MTVGVIGVSLAAPLASATAAPPLAVAFWRAGAGGVVTLPWVLARHRRELGRVLADRAAPRRTGMLAASVAAGLLLAVHFGLWIPSLRLTSVTSATALVCTSPVWTGLVQALLARRSGPRSGRPAGRAVIVGVTIALAGVLAITGADAGLSLRALGGDALALGGGVAAAAYVLAGERARQEVSTATYTVLAYGTCALVLLPVCLIGAVPLAGYPARTWIELAVLTLSAQLLGHTALNLALPVVGATPLALAILFEVPGAALIAWVWLGQPPPVLVVPGTLLLLAGLIAVVRARRTEEIDVAYIACESSL